MRALTAPWTAAQAWGVRCCRAPWSRALVAEALRPDPVPYAPFPQGCGRGVAPRVAGGLLRPPARSDGVEGRVQRARREGFRPGCAGNRQAWGRWASGPRRSWPPVPGRPRTSLRAGSMSATCRGVPSRRQSRRHSCAGGCATRPKRPRTACGLNTTGRVWRVRGRVCAKTDHGRWRVVSSKHGIPSRWIRTVRSATGFASIKHRPYGRIAAALRWSGERRSCGPAA